MYIFLNLSMFTSEIRREAKCRAGIQQPPANITGTAYELNKRIYISYTGIYQSIELEGKYHQQTQRTMLSNRSDKMEYNSLK